MQIHSAGLRFRRCTLLVCLAVVATASQGQSVKDAEKDFKASLLNQQAYLRNFSADSVVHAHWTGSGVELDEPGARIFASIHVTSVSVKAKSFIG